jgi:putative ABC transport system permease protein
MLTGRREAEERDWPLRLLRGALVLYPRRFRQAYAREMLEVFTELRHERGVRGGALGAAGLWIRTLGNVVFTALVERLVGEPEPCREGVGTMGSLLQDLRYGLRMMLRSPVFTGVAALTLALGIGANTAVFGFVNALLLERLSLPEPERVVRLYGTNTEGSGFDVFSYPNYKDLRDRAEAFEGLAAYRVASAGLGEGPEVSEIRVELVTGNYFSTLRVGAGLGRMLLPSDDERPGAHPVVVLSDRFWKGRLGADPGAVGKTLRLNGQPFTVVGVAAQGFRGSYETFDTAVWVPLAMHESIRRTGLDYEKRGWGWLQGMGRLRPGLSLAQAQAEVDRIGRQLAEERPQDNEGHGYALHPAGAMPEAWRGGAVSLLGFFLLLVTLVLLVACVNIAGVLLARATSRRRETAVRQALGATRGRLVRQWLVECLSLALLGGAAGLVVALWVRQGLVSLSADFMPGFSPDLGFDWKVLGFALLMALLVGTLFGLLPGLSAGGQDVVTALKEASGSSGGGRRTSCSFGAFVVFQMSVSLVLLVTAGLLLRTLQEAHEFDLGFETRNLLLGSVNLNAYGYTEPRGQQFYRELGERLRSVPGVEAVSFATIVPLAGDVDRSGFYLEGHSELVSLDINVVGRDYFTTMGTPLVAGEGLESRPGGPPGVVVNEAMARRFWPDGTALGRRIRYGKSDGPEAEIVGVARDIRYGSLSEEPRPFVYASLEQAYTPACAVHIRTAGDPRASIRAIREAVAAIDPAVPVQKLETFEDVFRTALLPQVVLAPITGAFATLALVLSAIGLYGLMSYSVSQRTREIGVRMALGAGRAEVLVMVVRQGMRLALLGLGIGLAGAFAGTRFLSGLLFGVSPTDPRTFAALSGLLLLVALAACFIPARRATSIDPMAALRCE